MKNTYESIISDQKYIVEKWGEDGKRVVETIVNTNHSPMSFDTFLDKCTTCGGNWGGMVLTGIKEIAPEVYDAIPNHMGNSAWNCLCAVTRLMGIYCD